MKAIILTEGSSKKGLGHIERCKGLYDEISSYGIDVTLVIDNDNEDLKILDGYNYISMNWKNDSIFSFEKCYVIVDSYYLTDKLIDDITSHFYRCLFVDDLNLIEYKNAYVVNPSIYGNSLNYPIKDDVNYLIGEDYVILRKPFQKQFDRKINDKIKTITITMGGSDIKNLTPTILKSLEVFEDVTINVIGGNANLNCSKNINFLKNLNAYEMCDIFLKSDLVISACGQTIFELIQTKTIFIAINVIENQIYNEKYIKQNNLGIILDEKNIENELIPTINKLNNDISIRKNLLTNLCKISFEKGVHNIISTFLDTLVLKKVTIEDAKTLYDWRNSETVRNNSFNKDKIDFKSHEKWLLNKLNDKNCIMYIAYLNDEKVGQIRCDISNDIYEISYSIDENFMGKGFGKLMLKALEIELLSQNINATLVGKVKFSNIASIKVFEKMGYIKTQKDGYYEFTRRIL